MRRLGPSLLCVILAVVCVQGVARAGQLPDISSLPVGFRYCPAPGADNSDFNCSYYAVDAQTGVMTRVVDGAPKEELNRPVDMEEKVLFVAPPISVENRYVPYPGAAPQEPPPQFRAQQYPQPPQYNHYASAPGQERYAQAQPQGNYRDGRQYQQGRPQHDGPMQPMMQGRQQRQELPWWKRVLR